MKTALVILLLSVSALAATAGDYFPYRPKHLSYDFAAPFDDASSPKLPPARLIITTQPDADGRYPYRMGVAPLTSMEVELGKVRLSVPRQLLRDIGPLNLSTLDFHWVNGRYYIALSRKPVAEGSRPERVEFIFRDGTLVDLWFDRTSQRNKHRKLFEGTTPFSTEPATPK